MGDIPVGPRRTNDKAPQDDTNNLCRLCDQAAVSGECCSCGHETCDGCLREDGRCWHCAGIGRVIESVGTIGDAGVMLAPRDDTERLCRLCSRNRIDTECRSCGIDCCEARCLRPDGRCWVCHEFDGLLGRRGQPPIRLERQTGDSSDEEVGETPVGFCCPKVGYPFKHLQCRVTGQALCGFCVEEPNMCGECTVDSSMAMHGDVCPGCQLEGQVAPCVECGVGYCSERCRNPEGVCYMCAGAFPPLPEPEPAPEEKGETLVMPVEADPREERPYGLTSHSPDSSAERGFEACDLWAPDDEARWRWAKARERYGVKMRPCRAIVEKEHRGAQVRARSEPRQARSRVGHYEYAEPLREIDIDEGVNCNVPVRIGDVTFRICVDTGGSRSVVRADFVKALLKNARTKDSVKERMSIRQSIVCSGICEGMKSEEMTRVARIEMFLDPVSEDGGKVSEPVAIELEMGELGGAADALLMGFPEIAKFGCRFYDDEDGNLWVDFTRLGVVLLAEGKLNQAM